MRVRYRHLTRLPPPPSACVQCSRARTGRRRDSSISCCVWCGRPACSDLTISIALSAQALTLWVLFFFSIPCMPPFLACMHAFLLKTKMPAAASIVPDDGYDPRTDGRIDRTTTGRCALPSVLLFHHAHVKSIYRTSSSTDPAGDVRYVRTYSYVTLLAAAAGTAGDHGWRLARFWKHMHACVERLL